MCVCIHDNLYIRVCRFSDITEGAVTFGVALLLSVGKAAEVGLLTIAKNTKQIIMVMSHK